MNPKVDAFLDGSEKWQKEMKKLRKIVLNCNLTEELKWGVPCYTVNKNNVVLIHAFKEYCALLFIKGSLLSDSHSILIQQTENVQAGRQVRFTHIDQITEQEAILKAYIFEAVEIEKAGMKVVFKKTSDYQLPEELTTKFNEIPQFKTAFEALTPGRQRAYIFYFSQAKQAKTRETRIENCIPKILMGKGLNDL